MNKNGFNTLICCRYREMSLMKDLISRSWSLNLFSASSKASSLIWEKVKDSLVNAKSKVSQIWQSRCGDVKSVDVPEVKFQSDAWDDCLLGWTSWWWSACSALRSCRWVDLRRLCGTSPLQTKDGAGELLYVFEGTTQQENNDSLVTRCWQYVSQAKIDKIIIMTQKTCLTCYCLYHRAVPIETNYWSFQTRLF